MLKGITIFKVADASESYVSLGRAYFLDLCMTFDGQVGRKALRHSEYRDLALALACEPSLSLCWASWLHSTHVFLVFPSRKAAGLGFHLCSLFGSCFSWVCVGGCCKWCHFFLFFLFFLMLLLPWPAPS